MVQPKAGVLSLLDLCQVRVRVRVWVRVRVRVRVGPAQGRGPLAA